MPGISSAVPQVPPTAPGVTGAAATLASGTSARQTAATATATRAKWSLIDQAPPRVQATEPGPRETEHHDGPASCQRLVLRSLKDVYKASAVGAWLGLGPSPDPGTGAGVELGGGHLGGVGNLIGVGEGLPGQRLAPEDPPPAFLQVQP